MFLILADSFLKQVNVIRTPHATLDKKSISLEQYLLTLDYEKKSWRTTKVHLPAKKL